MIQRFHSWARTQKNWKQRIEGMFVHHVHSSIIHNSQEVETTQEWINVDGWMDKHSVV